MLEIDGATGQLYLDEDGRIHRRLAWAQFQRGEPVPLPEPEMPAGPIQDISENAELLTPEAADDATQYRQEIEL